MSELGQRVTSPPAPPLLTSPVSARAVLLSPGAAPVTCRRRAGARPPPGGARAPSRGEAAAFLLRSGGKSCTGRFKSSSIKAREAGFCKGHNAYPALTGSNRAPSLYRKSRKWGSSVCNESNLKNPHKPTTKIPEQNRGGGAREGVTVRVQRAPAPCLTKGPVDPV